MNKFNKKGFTLIEMLVVIAIIAVLVSIVIPVVGDATEKAREAADAANIRSAIATATINAMTTGDEAVAEADCTQNGAFEHITDIGGMPASTFATEGDTDYTITVTSDEDGNVSFAKDGTAIVPDTGAGEGENTGAGEGENTGAGE